ncbi:MAG: iron-siderophore ABC transporter substrate-binding protein [Cyanobacteria bacterium J06631_9]
MRTIIQSVLRCSLHQPLSRQRRFILLSGGAALFTACTQTRKPQSVPSESSSQGVTTIQHALGEADIPANPNRVVVWGYAMVDAVLALGVQPVGVPGVILDEMAYLEWDRAAIASIGDAEQPNLETLSTLDPDLILTTEQLGASSYPLLSQVAPTVAFGIDERGEWRATANLCAEALGKQTEAEKLSADYESKLAQLKSQSSQSLQDIEASIVYITPGEIRTMGAASFPGSVLRDAGLSRPSAQSQGPDRRNLSLESLNQIDGDVIFMLAPQSDSERAAGVRDEIKRVKAMPLWSQLKAVKNNQVYEVAPYWALGNYIAADLMLDDLLAYLS